MLMYLIQAGVLLVSISAQAEARAFGNYYPYVAAPVGATSYTGTGYNLFNPLGYQYPTNTGLWGGFRTSGVAAAPAPAPAPGINLGLASLTSLADTATDSSIEGLSQLMGFLKESMKKIPSNIANLSPAERQRLKEDTQIVNGEIALFCERMISQAEKGYQRGSYDQSKVEATKKTCEVINQIGSQILEGLP